MKTKLLAALLCGMNLLAQAALGTTAWVAGEASSDLGLLLERIAGRWGQAPLAFACAVRSAWKSTIAARTSSSAIPSMRAAFVRWPPVACSAAKAPSIESGTVSIIITGSLKDSN